ncbi:MAG: hypothetical protein ACK42I_09035 [Thermomicrobium sp.]
MPRNGATYDAWLFAVRVTAELLLQANREDRSLYADVAPRKEWQRNAITIWSGPTSDHMVPVLRLGDMTALWVWDGRFEFDSTEAQTVMEELWPESANEPLQSTVSCLAAHARITLEEGWRNFPKGRFDCWARMFAAAVDCLPSLSSRQPWTMQTMYHSGWGTYYLQFNPLEEGRSFALSEEGHLAMLPVGSNQDLKSFNIRSSIDEGSPREAVTALLLPRLQRCADDAEGALEGDE